MDYIFYIVYSPIEYRFYSGDRITYLQIKKSPGGGFTLIKFMPHDCD